MTVNTLTPVWLDNKSRGQRDSYREGMVMEQWDNEKKAMTRYTIDRVTDLSNTLTLRNASGDTITEKVNRIDSSWSLYKPQTLALAEGDPRLIGSEDARFAALQQSQNGDVQIVTSLTDGLNTARENPETGVLIRLSGEGELLNMKRVMGGVNLRNVTEATQNDARNGDPLPFIKDEDERRQQALEKRQEEAARKVSGEERDAVRNVANADALPDGEKDVPLQVPEKEADRSRDAVAQVAMENTLRDRMQQIERELVRDKTLGE